MTNRTVFSFTDRQGKILSSSGIGLVEWEGHGSGKYTVTFDPPFTYTPVVTLFPPAKSGPRYLNSLTVDNSQVSFRWSGLDGEPVDGFSNLFAVGE